MKVPTLLSGRPAGRAVGVFPLLVVVQDQHAQPLALARRGPFQHLLVAGRVAERRLRPLAREQVDVLGLAGIVVVQLQLGLADQLTLAFGIVLVARLQREPITSAGATP